MLLAGLHLLAAVRGSSASLASVPPQARVPLCQPVVFEGEVRRGAGFQHDLGHDLVFSLDPVPNGWTVRVWPRVGTRTPPDLAELATPPYRSVSPLLLTTDFGFRAQDVVAWTPRNFHYLPRPADRPAAVRAFEQVLATPHPTAAAELAVAHTVQISAEAQLTILDADLLPGSADASRAAATMATHLSITPHTMRSGPATPLGTVERLRFRVTLALAPRGAGLCREPGH